MLVAFGVYLRSHVSVRARGASTVLYVVKYLRYTEIGQLKISVFSHQYVLGFDIAMKDTRAMTA